MRRALLATALALGLSTAASGEDGLDVRFAEARRPWDWDLPRDHRSHPGHALEWWYLVGHLEGAGGERLAYQATFFRSALAPGRVERSSPFAARDVLLYHGAVTDVGSGTYAADQAVSRAAAGWASASPERLDVHVGPHALRAASGDLWELRAGVRGWRLALDLVLDRPPVLHGDSGLSAKGPRPGQASHYVSRVHLPTRGHVLRPDGTRLEVTGASWFDQEFGSGQLDDSQVGWDWFGLMLDDGSALMAYRLRQDDGSVSPTSSGTFVDPAGSTVHLRRDDLSVVVLDRWTSPRSGAVYPAGWTLRAPSVGLELEVRPLVADQERGADVPGAVVCWEGACEVEGRRGGRELTGLGHVELVGHASPLGLLRARDPSER